MSSQNVLIQLASGGVYYNHLGKNWFQLMQRKVGVCASLVILGGVVTSKKLVEKLKRTPGILKKWGNC